MNADIIFTNQFALDGGGWAQLAPFGDFPGKAMIRQSDGSTLKIDALQRLDREAARQMVAKFHSPWNRLKRYFTGCPIYVGHPDAPGSGVETSPRDFSSKGMIVDLQVREDGLYCKPVFTNEGSQLVEGGTYRAFSGHWTALEISAEGTNRIFRPEMLKSAGLTNHPNLPVRLLNEQSTNETTPTELVNKQLILQFLATQGITISNEAEDSEIHSALEQLGHRLTTAETTLASRVVEMESIHAELANERKFHAEALLEAALGEGCITSAQRAEWASRFTADFANTAKALAELPPVMKTRSITATNGGRKTEIASSAERRRALDAIIKAEMRSNGADYDSAFLAVQKANPALFDAMKKPGAED